VCGEAENGQEAVYKVQQLQPDLIVLDMNMPVLNGFDAARQIRKTAPSTKVIILTLHETANLPSVLNETDADAYLTKSHSVRDLISTIKHLSLTGRSANDPNLTS
jgi:DNA-binding NarL/FixJ family response regulator